MGVSENIFGTQCIALTYARPFTNGIPGEMLRDDYTGVLFRWSANDGAWIAWGTTEQPFTLYVNGVTGNDANSGALTAPLATFQEAIRRIPPKVLHTIFIDVAAGVGGAPIIYIEDINIEGIELGAPIYINGKQRQAVGLTGPNAVAPNPANTGDEYTLDVPGAGWAVNELMGKFARFTAGPRTGETYPILSNTPTRITFGVPAFASIANYGLNDGLEIWEITTILQSSGVSGRASLVVEDAGSWSLNLSYVQINTMSILGDAINNYAMSMGGTFALFFNQCVIAGWVANHGKAGGTWRAYYCFLQQAVAPGSLAWFDVSPQGDIDLYLDRCGIFGCIVQGSDADMNMRLHMCVWMPGIGLAASAQLLDFRRGVVLMWNCFMSGDANSVPILLRRSAYGSIEINSCILERSSADAIVPDGNALSKVDLSIDQLPIVGFITDIRNNAAIGLNLEGPISATLYSALQSSIANGTFGVRLINGSMLRFLGAVPTITGGGGDIDFDGGAPVAWAAVPVGGVTGLNTLTRVLR